MSQEMTAVVMTHPGGPEVLEPRRLPLPWPRSDRHVLVRLKAASVNPADVYFRSLGPYIQSEEPCILGHDGAGVVAEVGAAVTRFRPGDEVCFCNGGLGGDPGTYADYAAVHEAQLAAKPAGVSFEETAALPLVFITAWEALVERAGLKAGERVLIHAGAGGTGHIAVQLAALEGAKVAATVSSQAKADFIRRLGAERPILYREEDFVETARSWSQGRGLDVALDNVGPEAMQRTYRAMAPYGRIVTLMGTPGDDAEETAYVQNLTIHNVMMLTPMVQGLAERLAGQAAIVTKGMALLAEGKLKPHIAASFPLAEAAAAQARLEAGGTTGKIVLTMEG